MMAKVHFGQPENIVTITSDLIESLSSNVRAHETVLNNIEVVFNTEKSTGSFKDSVMLLAQYGFNLAAPYNPSPMLSTSNDYMFLTPAISKYMQLLTEAVQINGEMAMYVEEFASLYGHKILNMLNTQGDIAILSSSISEYMNLLAEISQVKGDFNMANHFIGVYLRQNLKMIESADDLIKPAMYTMPIVEFIVKTGQFDLEMLELFSMDYANKIAHVIHTPNDLEILNANMHSVLLPINEITHAAKQPDMLCNFINMYLGRYRISQMDSLTDDLGMITTHMTEVLQEVFAHARGLYSFGAVHNLMLAYTGQIADKIFNLEDAVLVKNHVEYIKYLLGKELYNDAALIDALQHSVNLKAIAQIDATLSNLKTIFNHDKSINSFEASTELLNKSVNNILNVLTTSDDTQKSAPAMFEYFNILLEFSQMTGQFHTTPTFVHHYLDKMIATGNPSPELGRNMSEVIKTVIKAQALEPHVLDHIIMDYVLMVVRALDIRPEFSKKMMQPFVFEAMQPITELLPTAEKSHFLDLFINCYVRENIQKIFNIKNFAELKEEIKEFLKFREFEQVSCDKAMVARIDSDIDAAKEQAIINMVAYVKAQLNDSIAAALLPASLLDIVRDHIVVEVADYEESSVDVAGEEFKGSAE
jgi:hypothetical protein